MTKKVAAIIDIDGVVYPFSTTLSLIAAEHTGRPISDFPEALTWNFYKDQWNMTTPEFLELMAIGAKHYGLFGGATEPFPRSVEGLHRLRAMDVHVHFATDCGDDEDSTGARANRLIWLPAFGIDLGDFDITFTADKPSVALPYVEDGYHVVAIDDKVENYEALLDCGADAFLQTRKWNEHIVAKRVDDLVEFADHVASSINALV
jgi:hypothetical protein